MVKDKKYQYLFNPGEIGNLWVPNRIVMAPMATNYANETVGVTERNDLLSR